MSRLSDLILRAVAYEDGCVERVNHFLKVFAFAKTIAEGEGVAPETQEILEAAAVLHDIGIRACFAKYGDCNGKHQEAEGPAVARLLLPGCNYTEAECARICYLIAHHHTYTDIEGDDYQILVEADFLVNLFENELDSTAAKGVRDKIFRTETGKKLLTDLYC